MLTAFVGRIGREVLGYSEALVCISALTGAQIAVFIRFFKE